MHVDAAACYTAGKSAKIPIALGEDVLLRAPPLIAVKRNEPGESLSIHPGVFSQRLKNYRNMRKIGQRIREAPRDWTPSIPLIIRRSTLARAESLIYSPFQGDDRNGPTFRICLAHEVSSVEVDICSRYILGRATVITA